MHGHPQPLHREPEQISHGRLQLELDALGVHGLIALWRGFGLSPAWIWHGFRVTRPINCGPPALAAGGSRAASEHLHAESMPDPCRIHANPCESMWIQGCNASNTIDHRPPPQIHAQSMQIHANPCLTWQTFNRPRDLEGIPQPRWQFEPCFYCLRAGRGFNLTLGRPGSFPSKT